MARSLTSVSDLLSACFSLNSEDVARINVSAAQSGITPGEFLHNEGALKPHVVRGAILCQLFLTEELLPKQLALSALKLTSQLDISIEDSLEKLGWDRAYYENIRQMSSMLEKAGVISRAEKTLAYEICFDSRLPFLSALVQRKAIGHAVADYALTIQDMVTRQTLSFDDAVELLARCQRSGAGVSEHKALRGKTFESKGIRLGELLVAAGFVTSMQLISAVENGRVQGKLVGETLVDQGVLSQEHLESALDVQKRIEDGNISVAEGVDELVGPHQLFAQQFGRSA